jgi:sulfur carrier protein
MIEVVINGKKQTIKEGLNLTQMLEVLNYHDNSFAVAVNGTFVSLVKYNETVIKSGDEIEILAPMVGG